MKILIINGANINLLGKREKEHYGNFTYKDLLEYFKTIEKEYSNLDLQIDEKQSNIEGEIVNFIQEANNYDGLIINPAGYTHTSVVILDALLCLNIPIIEVHLSNIHNRDDFRSKSITAKACKGVIAGFGKRSYYLAINEIVNIQTKLK